MDIIYDMETSDPDDFLTLCFLAAHPSAQLRAVTVTPGSKAQIGIVRYVLELVGKIIPVGSRKPDHPKSCVSSFHYSVLGDIPERIPDGIAHEVLAQTFQKFPAAVMLTGAPLQNLHLLMQHQPSLTISRWVAQGGFAGDSVVPPEHRLSKFAGHETFATFNFNGDPTAAKFLLNCPRILQRDLVSKNVCHGVVYDENLHKKMAQPSEQNLGLRLIYQAMSLYLKKSEQGKKLHDPLAACVAIERSICQFAEVEMFRNQGKWGSLLKSNTQTFISISVDQQKFQQVFCHHQPSKSE